MRLSPVVRVAGAILLALAIVAPQAYASSHREALAILNEPCADNTDTFAWVSNGAHDKLYLIMDYNPLHEPGQGNQGFRACNGYRYEFHIGKGTSLKDEAVYRVEFKNTLNPAPAPGPTDAIGEGEKRYRATVCAATRGAGTNATQITQASAVAMAPFLRRMQSESYGNSGGFVGRRVGPAPLGQWSNRTERSKPGLT